MILIKGFGEFSFFNLFSILLSVFFSFISLFKKKSRIVSLLSCACHVLVVGVHVPVGLNCDQMEPPYEEHQSQYPVERSPNAYRSMRDYKNPPWVSTPFSIDPPTNAPYGSTYNHSWENHQNSSSKSRPPRYTPPTPPYYASTPQPPQPPQLSSSVEQAILNLSKLVDTFIEERKAVNVQANQKIDTMESKIDTMESSLDKRIDGLQIEIDQKFDNLQKSISRLTN